MFSKAVDATDTDNDTPYLLIPEEKVQDQVVIALTEYHKLSDAEKTNVRGEKVSPELEACNKKLYDTFASTVTSLLTALSSEKAEINSISVAIPSVANTVMSTYPDVFNNARLKAVTGSEIFLYMAMMTAHVLHKKYGKNAPEKAQNVFEKLEYLANGFSFAFSTGCKIAAVIVGQDVNSTANIDAGVGSLLGISFAIGIFEMYGLSQKPGSRMNIASGSLYFGFAVGSFVDQIGRLFDYFPVNHDHPTPLERVIQWAPAVLTLVGAGAGFFYSKRNSVSKPLGAANNFLYDVGTLFESITLKDPIAAAIIGTKITLIGASHVVIKHACKIPAKEAENLSQQEPAEVKEHASSVVTSAASRSSSSALMDVIPPSLADDEAIEVTDLEPRHSPRFTL